MQPTKLNIVHVESGTRKESSNIVCKHGSVIINPDQHPEKVRLEFAGTVKFEDFKVVDSSGGQHCIKDELTVPRRGFLKVVQF